jgi:hypothetical protein
MTVEVGFCVGGFLPGSKMPPGKKPLSSVLCNVDYFFNHCNFFGEEPIFSILA